MEGRQLEFQQRYFRGARNKCYYYIGNTQLTTSKKDNQKKKLTTHNNKYLKNG